VAIKYIAAIMGAYAAIADNSYSVIGQPLPASVIRNNPALLAELYQGVEFDPPGRTHFQIDLHNAEKYFSYKALFAPYSYTIRPNPNKFMDPWVRDNLLFLDRALK